MILPRILRNCRQDERGVALVEFAIVLPMLLLIFAVIIEGSRLMLSYQATIAGVRDATRYMSRVLPANLCAGGGSVAGYGGTVTTIVAQRATGVSVLPSAVTITGVVPAYRCVSGSFRTGTTAVVSVSAAITVTYPFAGVWQLVGGTLPTVTTTIRDEARVIGS